MEANPGSLPRRVQEVAPFENPQPAAWGRVDNTPLGTPRGRYAEHSNKFSLNCETKVIEPVRERTTLPKVDAR
jgi:hypothetical protein